ncbi:hypothetical protein GCM10025786_38970 [Nocardioides caeni]
MVTVKWFSAMLRFLIWVGPEVRGRGRSVVLLRAADHEAAFAAALARGRALERDFVNADGEEVRWRLQLVETIDELEEELADGREVYSEPFPPVEIAPVDDPRHPEDLHPGSSGV